jgi:hypothetical protein
MDAAIGSSKVSRMSMSRGTRHFGARAAICAALAACGGALSTDPRDTALCTENTSSTCVCGNGQASGVRSCDSRGRWSKCVCSGASAPAPPPTAAPPPVATEDPDGVWAASVCGGPDNVFHVARVPDQFPKTFTGPTGRWYSNESRPPDFAHVRFTSSDLSESVQIYLSTRGRPLAPGVYADAVSLDKDGAGKPSFGIAVNYSSCGGGLTATFWVLEIEWQAAKLTRLLAAFDYRCGGVGPLMRGCVGYRMPPDEDAGP